MSGKSPAACVITGFGINADEELAQAFLLSGAQAARVHVRDLIGDPGLLSKFRILAAPRSRTSSPAAGWASGSATASRSS